MSKRKKWPIVPATLPGGLNELIKKKLIKAGVVSTEDDSHLAKDERQQRRHVFAGHCVRGNAASTLEAVAPTRLRALRRDRAPATRQAQPGDVRQALQACGASSGSGGSLRNDMGPVGV